MTNLSDTIVALKVDIGRESGIPVNEQHLFFEGQVLEDVRTLGSYQLLG